MKITDMLAGNAELYPDETALIEFRPDSHFRSEISWKEFDDNANRIANALLARGIQKEDKVIIWMMNSIHWLEIYFGILKTGAWVVPLNFRFTAKDMKYCNDIAEAKIMFLGKEFVERVESVRSDLKTIEHYICVAENTPEGMEGLEAFIGDAPEVSPGIEMAEDDPCGLYFTSGTTGAPKPILLCHCNLSAAAIAEKEHHQLRHEDNFVLIPPMYHTGAKIHWFGNLVVGGKATLLPEMSSKNLLETVHRERGTVVFLLVPWAQDVLGALDRGELKLDDYDLSCWRMLHMGAQPIPPSVVQHWKRYFPDMLYDTTYGLSESTGPGCCHLGLENEHKVGAIGKPGYGWEVRIVDEEGNDVPQGAVGELIARGGGVMREYYRNPEKTAETLKDGWLYTGDMAKVDEDGFIYLVDRKKDVIIMGGENIFPVEVENVIQCYEKVYDAAVIGIPDDRLGEIAAAIIDPQPGETITEEEIIEFCVQNLPRYKRPRKVFFDKVPRNPTGKIEKPKLREKYTGHKESFKI
ncbi:MAG: AMP-binding protein [Dehalococcoidales bacterium]|nr:AMP-binding protein [Dehalococcoidales bacterium]